MSRVMSCNICGEPHWDNEDPSCNCIELRQPIDTEGERSEPKRAVASAELARKLAPRLVEELGRELLRNNQSKRQLRVIRRAGKVIKLIQEVQ